MGFLLSSALRKGFAEHGIIKPIAVLTSTAIVGR